MRTTAIETSQRRPRFVRADRAPPFRLTERDVEICRQVARHRFLRSTHISRLLAAPHKKVLQRLTPLYHAGYLDRPRAQLQYHVLGGGSEPLVYALGKRGADLLAEADDLDRAGIDWSAKNQQTGREFILHTLAVADVRLALTLACRSHRGISLQEPEELLATTPEATRAEPKPWAWRVRLQYQGGRQEVGLIPDYVFALLLPDGKRRAFFVEVDRGTMPLERSSLYQTSILRKLLAYEATYAQALHTTRYGWKAFRVLFVTVNAERAANMRALVQRTADLRETPLFFFADHPAILQSDILGPCWLDASGKIHALV